MCPDDYFDTELAALKRATTTARSVASRLLWKAAMARRTRRIGVVLQAVPELVPSIRARRVKRPGAWLVLAERAAGEFITAMTIPTLTLGRSLEELAMPIPLQVHRQELVDAARLHQLVMAGVVQVVPAARSGP